MEKHWCLTRCGLFERLAPEELSTLESRSRIRTFAAREPVYLPADASSAVYLLASGRVKVCHLTTDGKESILAFIQAGELFGELALLDAGERDEYVEAIEKATVVMIPASEMQRLMQAHADISLGITKIIGFRRRRIERRLKNLLFQSNRERLTHLLLDLAEDYGQPADEGILLGIKLSHQDLANVIGSTRETVTVILGQLRTEGLLQLGRQRIVIAQPERLARSVRRSAPQPARPFVQMMPSLSPT